MSLHKCMLSQKLGGKINLAELKENAAAYQERGMSPNDAMIRAVSEKVEALQLEEKKIVSTVRDAYVAATGKKLVAAPVEEKSAKTKKVKPVDAVESTKKTEAHAQKEATEKPDDAVFSRAKDEKEDLLIHHNLTEENLLHADRMGGIAVPSLAITKHDAPIKNFGDITLIGSRAMADPKGYAGTKVFGADIYSPRYPEINHSVNGKALAKLNDLLKPFRQDGEREFYGSDLSRIDDLTQSKAFKAYAADRIGIPLEDLNWQQMKSQAGELLRRSGADERIFKGYTYSGGRKYTPHTLENVVKILKKDIRGGENFNYGVGSIRAGFTPQFKSIKQIKENKDRLVDKDTFGKVKEAIDNELVQIANNLQPFHQASDRFGFLDTVSNTMVDAAKMGIPRAMKENGFDDVPEEYQIEMRNFLNKLRTLPSEYFEAKILRGVDLSEFSGAVIPNDASQKVRDLLKRHGVPIAEYEGEEDRKNVVSEFTKKLHEEKGNILFSRQENGRVTDTQEFKKWFGDSKVVDADGKPLVVYHGTNTSGIESFVPSETGGIFFSSDQKTARSYGKVVMPSYLSMQNPLVIDGEGKSFRELIPSGFIEQAKKAGHDGVMVENFRDSAAGYNEVGTTYIAFKPEQIKAATGNNGDFDASNPGIRFRRDSFFSIGMEKQELQTHVDVLTKGWKNAPKIEVVESVSDLPFDAPNNARGAYGNGKVWLVSDNISAPADAQFVLFHEALGHAGIRGMFGDRMMTEMRAIAMKNENIRKAAAEWREANEDIRGKQTDEQWHSLSVEEALANIASQGRPIKGIEKFLAAMQEALRSIGLHEVANWLEKATNAEAMKVLAGARRHIEHGDQAHVFGGQEAQAYQRSSEPKKTALQSLSEHDELFKLPKSTKTTVEGIAADNDAGIKVEKVDIPGEVMYKMTMPDGNEARLMVRKHNPYGDTVYGFKMVDGDMHAITEGRPGKNAEAVHGKDDVYIDVVDLDEGKGYGAKMYNIAATYAHNTGKVFIGDPAGLSDEALRRRPEQMLSSALKFGTTEHLGPHPRQVEGDAHVGVPALDWAYGDHVGNIKKLIDVNQKNIENAGGNGDIAYNKKTGQFEGSDGKVITRDDIARMAKAGVGRAAEAGGSTLARHALFKSLLQGEGKGVHGSNGLLESLGKQLRDHDSTRLDSPFRDILYSRTTDSLLGKVGVQQSIRDNVSNLFQSEKTFNSWWHKTVGTQYHKAQIDKHFKRVYDATQRYLSSVSAFANEAADLAPSLLPKLDGLSDLTKKSASKVDTTAAGNAIFQGTLTDQKVYSDAELKSKFNLNDKQITMYREFRAATDKSLDDMGKTDMLRYASADGHDVMDHVLSAPDVTAAADILAKHLNEIGQQDAAKVIHEKASHIAQLKQEGYAPLMRFGEHTVYVTDKDGNQLFFGMAETAREAAQMARDMKETYPDANVTKGILSTEGAKLFSGISPDTIEVFAKTTGLDKNPMFQDYLKLVVNNRSALKRLIARKGVAGFSQDTTRVLASFLTSNARASSKNLHAGEMTQAANDIPKEKGDVRDEAIKLVHYIQNPVEEAAAVRGLLFTNFIGGSIASAAINMTQPVMMTLPYLSQFGGVGQASKILASAMKMAATHAKSESITDPKLRAALMKAEAEGIVSPQEIHNLQAEAMKSSKGINIGGKEIVPAFAMRKMAIVWGGLFGLAEQFNRKSTFIAAYQIAQNMTPAQFEKAGVSNAYEFATKSIAETQGVYNRGNRPDWARGALGATLMTFKQYSIAYMEFLTRLPPKERALALAILVVAAGANGLPFADDLDDIIDTIGQALGYNFNTKKTKARFLTNTLGQGASDFMLHGFSGVSGMPLDVSMRMGMGNLLPGTGVLKKSNKDKGDDYAEFFGAAGGYGKKVVDASSKLLEGEVLGAFKAISSTATANVAKAVDMMQTNTYRDSKGRKVIDTDFTDALVKAVGFQPGDVAHEQAKLNMARQDIDMANQIKAGIAEKWAQGIYEKDPKAAVEASAAVREWNLKNPDSRITVSPAAVANRVKEMRMTKEQRVIKHAPKSMRAGLREELSN